MLVRLEYFPTKQMGSIVSQILNKFWGKRQIKIVILGICGAGKTTLLYRFKTGEVVPVVIPTVSYNEETVDYKNMNISAWDVRGSDIFRRGLWKYYFKNTDGVIFVVDSSDCHVIDDVKSALTQLLYEEPDLENAPLLVFANKQDLPNAITPSELEDQLSLHKIKNRKWHIEGVSALHGTGLLDGMDWLCNEIRNT